MPYEFKLPDLGEGLTEGEIARWLVEEGQEIAEDDPLVEIQTDKTTVEIPSPAAGVVSRILVAEGEIVPVGTVLVLIGGDGVTETERPAPSNKVLQAPSNKVLQAPSDKLLQAPSDKVLQAPDKVRATPLVRRLARELDVDLEALEGTGPQGRITEEDVRAAAAGRVVEGRREPVRGIRRRIVEHLTAAHREIPAVTWVEECDFTDIDLALLIPTVLRATALSLKEYPELNARFEADEIVYLDRYDLGVAVQTEQGLVVPIIRSCDTRSIDELDVELRRLAESARAGTLKPEELRGSTFSVTSAGKLGGVMVTPLINYPEVGILGIHRIAERPVVRGGEIMARRMGNVSVTFDHRVVDGARAAEFGLAVIGRLEPGG